MTIRKYANTYKGEGVENGVKGSIFTVLGSEKIIIFENRGWGTNILFWANIYP